MSTIKLKRSASTGSPANLAQGELAYSYLAGTQSNGGDRLYIGTGAETNGEAANLDVIGGKYFTSMLDHTVGTLTASSALMVDSSKKINEFFVDDLKLDGAEISSTATNSDISLSPNGTGKVQINSNATITGDLVVEGTTTTIDSTTVSLADPQFELASTNNNDDSNGITTDSVDFGTYGNYNSDPGGANTTAYAGWFRDASDSGKFKIYDGLTAEPTTTVDTSNAGYGVATVVANIEGNVKGDVKSSNGTTVLDSGTDGTDATFTGAITGDVTGNADTATTLETARTIGGVSFNGSANIDLPGVNTSGNQDTSGNAATATTAGALTTAVNIGGVSFDGSADIDLAGVNTAGNQDTSGNAATATALATGRTIALTGDVTGTSDAFDGSGNLSFATTIANNSVALGTQTTGNYMSGISATADTGISVTHTAGEGSSATIAGIDATNTVKGVASFATANFTVASGAVSIAAVDGGTY